MNKYKVETFRNKSIIHDYYNEATYPDKMKAFIDDQLRKNFLCDIVKQRPDLIDVRYERVDPRSSWAYGDDNSAIANLELTIVDTHRVESVCSWHSTLSLPVGERVLLCYMTDNNIPYVDIGEYVDIIESEIRLSIGKVIHKSEVLGWMELPEPLILNDLEGKDE